MDNLTTKAILAGLLFGIWPLFMNKSGLSGNTSSLAFATVVLICLLPFSYKGISEIPQSAWWWAVVAGVIASLGLLAFNGMLAKATVANVGTLFVLMIVVQTAVPALYQCVMDGSISWTKGAGFVLAAASAFLLMKG